MKKLLLIICIMFSITLNAQTDFCFGPKIGYKSYDFNFPLGSCLENKGKLTLGAFGRIMFDDFIIQPELMYNYIAIDFFQCTGPVTISKNHSFSIPVYFGYQFINRDNFNMRVNIGPAVNFNFDKYTDDMIVGSCIIDPDDQLFDNNLHTSYKYYDYNFANLCAAFSLGVDIHRFTLDLGYSLGFTNVFHNIDNPNIRQNSLTFTVGYRFGK